jgi:hypothetical protein
MKEYNGYANYFTWAVALWLDSSIGDQEYWSEVADEILDDSQTVPACLSDLFSPEEWNADHVRNRAITDFADRLKENISDIGPGSGICEDMPGMYADLFTAVFDFIDWREIAKNFIDAAEERRQEESES